MARSGLEVLTPLDAADALQFSLSVANGGFRHSKPSFRPAGLGRDLPDAFPSSLPESSP